MTASCKVDVNRHIGNAFIMTIAYSKSVSTPDSDYCDRCTEANCCCLAVQERYGSMNCAACGYDYVKVSGERAVPGYPSLRAQWLYGSIRLPCTSCSGLFCADLLMDVVEAYMAYKSK